MSPIVVTGTFSGLFDTLVVFPGSLFASKFRISNWFGFGSVTRS